MRRALMNSGNDVMAVTGRYIATDFSPKPTEFAGVKCRKCRCEMVFSSRATLTDLPLKMMGMVPCRCGGCLARFWVPFWRGRKR